jgi:hypothetical protein
VTAINWDNYYPKHSVRYYGWLPASTRLRDQLGRERLRYFTLCAREALDVFMLELEGVLCRDENGRLPDVVVCERDADAAAEILALVRPPLKEAILVGSLEEILTFEDTDDTRGRSAYENVRDWELRRRLRLKDLSERATQYFPFDIINFDPYGNLLRPPAACNRLYRAFCAVLELQRKTDRFLLFVTTPISDVHPDTTRSFKADLGRNVSSHGDVKRALLATLGTTDYEQIRPEARLAIGFAKSMVAAAAVAKRWRHHHHGIYVYESPSGSKILNSVVELWQAQEDPVDIDVSDIVNVIQNMPQCYSWAASERDDRVRRHLEEVKQYREAVRSEYSAM